MSDSVRPHRRQPTRLPRPWDSPGKNTGVGCHFILQCMNMKSESEVAQSCPTPSDPMDCSPPGSSVHGIFQASHWSGVPLPSPLFHINSGKYIRMQVLMGIHYQDNNPSILIYFTNYSLTLIFLQLTSNNLHYWQCPVQLTMIPGSFS